VTRRTIGMLLALAALAACSSGVSSSLTGRDRVEWKAYRAQVEPAVRRVLGPTEGAKAACKVLLVGLPSARYGVDPRPTLRSCARGDLSDARLEAHRQVDAIATNDHATGLLP